MNGWLESLHAQDWAGFAMTWGLRIAAALLLFAVGLRVARWIAGLAESGLTRARVEPTATQFLRKLAYVGLLVVLILAVLQIFGVPVTSMIAVLGAAGLAIGLALKDSLSNVASGVMLVTLKPFRVGDVVNVADANGTVESVSIFHTVLRGSDNQTITLPNNLITSSPIVNLTAGDMRRIELILGIGYRDDVEMARRLALEVMLADRRVLAGPAPDVLVYALADNAVNLGIRCHVRNEDWFGTKCALQENIKSAFDRAGISIPFPQRDMHLYLHTKEDSLRASALLTGRDPG